MPSGDVIQIAVGSLAIAQNTVPFQATLVQLFELDAVRLVQVIPSGDDAIVGVPTPNAENTVPFQAIHCAAAAPLGNVLSVHVIASEDV